jgi:hypothetical protein
VRFMTLSLSIVTTTLHVVRSLCCLRVRTMLVCGAATVVVLAPFSTAPCFGFDSTLHSRAP